MGRLAAGPIIAGRLVDLRRHNPSETLDRLLDQLAARQTEMSQLKAWLTDRSDCYSLWIDVRSDQRCWAELWVAELASNGGQEILRFVW